MGVAGSEQRAGVKMLQRAGQVEDTMLKQGGGALSALLQGRGRGAVVSQGAQPVRGDSNEEQSSTVGLEEQEYQRN